ncbi:TRAP transporter fused permease subunit [Mesorhizobium sp. J428]|uniref:TRAP transporter permease n=1 Tax=Mesorhizobium sp. J428 TaxID=2898440 RepID=UPI002150CEE0|nr:TRAP transporter fused permease subunit [Mesorhizobium sp. J428]MCR5856761.1 TRAP transporter fused permease subunit [Mesorhizobium sp. J428]
MSVDTEVELTAPTYGPVGYATTILGSVIALAGIAWGADLYRQFGLNFLAEQFLAVILGLAMSIVFLVRPFRGGVGIRTTAPWYDWCLVVLSLGIGTYMAWNYPRMLGEFFNSPPDVLIVAWLLFVLVMEALRRASGWPLVVTVMCFFLYALVGHRVGGALQTREVEATGMVVYLALDTSGLFGLVLLIGVTVVIPFVFFGQLLSSSGGASFFNDVSLVLMGRFRGGAAKIAILASSLFGSINGIVVSNILATGVVTIPMMKKSGFKPEHAAAIEASASNGGQLMPPVMGAVAFLMADFLQISYAEVAVAALVPSVLYYCALFIQADLEAAKGKILPVPASEIPRIVGVLMKGWLFLLPFAVLIYALFWQNREPENAAIFACIAVMAIGFSFGYGTHRLTPKEVWNCVVRTGVSSADIIMISAAAGFIMGILQLTGLSFALTLYLVDLGAGNVYLLLIIAAVLCIVLGMGMPTLGVYVLLAVLIVPALVETGIPPLAAHMFIIYLGMMSFVTPPVAIAAFFAANLAKADPFRTGWAAMRFSWTAYIVPFLFVFSPSLLLQSGSWTETALSISTAMLGVWFVSAGMIGYALGRLSAQLRVAFVIGGGLLMIPIEMFSIAGYLNVAGLALCVAALAANYFGRKAAATHHEVAAE